MPSGVYDHTRNAQSLEAYHKLVPEEKRADNSRMLRFNLTLASLPRIDAHVLEQVQERTNVYFNTCDEYSIKPGVASYALALGTERQTLYRWVKGLESSNMPDDTRNYIKNIYSSLNSFLESSFQDGQINPVASIFLLKNHFNYQDNSTVEVKAEVNQTSDGSLSTKYLPTTDSADYIEADYNVIDFSDSLD